MNKVNVNKVVDYANLLKENELLHSIIKEAKEEMKNTKHINVEDVYHIIEHEKKLNEILDKVEENK